MKECENDTCSAPILPYEDFCSEECWEEWHAKYEPETLARATVR
jgi:predicted nucleic acid-binding Zn ribbon protein